MRFTFPLQTLLNWKKNLEEFSQIRLAEKNTRLRIQEEEIQRLARWRAFFDQECMEKSIQGIQAGEYLVYKRYAEESFQELLSKENRKKHTIREIEVERENLISLTKARKILEKLKEKNFKKFIRQMDKAEQKMNDEIVVMKYRPDKDTPSPNAPR